MYFTSSPTQSSLNLRATQIRMSSAKTAGEFDVHHPFIRSCTWGGGNLKIVCEKLSLNAVGKKVSSEEDVSQLFEKLKVSPGVGLISDGPGICLLFILQHTCTSVCFAPPRSQGGARATPGCWFSELLLHIRFPNADCVRTAPGYRV